MKRNITLLFSITFGFLLLGCPTPDSPNTDKSKSHNANLSTLALDKESLSPAFTPETTDYSVSVANDISVITVTGIPADAKASLAYNRTQPVDLNVGSTAIVATVTAEDGTTTKSYTVTVTRAASVAHNSAKAITAFNFTSPAATGIITEATHMIAVDVPYATVVTALVPSITHTGASISPASGLARDFTNAQTYTVTAEDGTTQAYTVTVTVASSSAKAMTAFSLAGIAAIINEANHTIHAPVPSTANITSLAASFTVTGQNVKIGTTLQVSGTTVNNFTPSVTYIVTAADNSTQDYVVTALKSPGNLTSATVSTTQINLTWDDNSSNESGYQIERKLNSGGTYALIATTGANSASFSDTGLTEFTGYDYRVYAYDSLGNSLDTTKTNALTLPNPPSSLAVDSVSYYDDGNRRDSSIFYVTLSWINNSAYDGSIFFHASTDGGATYNLTRSVLHASPYSLSNWYLSASLVQFQENTTYLIYAKMNNQSVASNICSFTTPLYRPRIEGMGYNMTTGNPTLRVYDSSFIEDGYAIERSSTGTAGSYTAIGTLAAITTTDNYFVYNYSDYIDTGVSNGATATYYYRTRAYKGSAYSEYSPVCNNN